jgi:hypothetical protein
MIWLTRAAIGLMLATAATAPASAQAPGADSLARRIATVKDLYGAASYEEALAHLDVAAAESNVQLEQLRALCLLALGRIEDTERSLEVIVRRFPGHRMTADDVSPRLVAMYADVRKRALPSVARETYARARAAFDRGEHVAAARDLRALLTLLEEADAYGTPRDVLDLRLVAEGFLKLASSEVARTSTMPNPSAASPPPDPVTAPPATAPTPPVTPAPPPVNGTSRSPIYNADDTDIKAPIELSRAMPLWSPPEGFTASEFRGVLELVIDESGAVVSAVSVGPIMPNYDEALRTAARAWKYRPAMKRDGTPVRYRLLVGYLLKPVAR